MPPVTPTAGRGVEHAWQRLRRCARWVQTRRARTSDSGDGPCTSRKTTTERDLKNECAKTFASELTMVPFQRFTFEADEGPPVLLFKLAAARIVQTFTGKGFVMEDSSAVASQTNVLASEALKEVTGVIRSSRWAAEQPHGTRPDQNSPIVHLLVRLGGSMVAMSNSEKASLIQRVCRRSAKVRYSRAGKPKLRLEERWLQGLFLGVARPSWRDAHGDT